MKANELSSKAMCCWLAVAMLGPVALAAAASAWVAVLVAGILCGALCVAVLRYCGNEIFGSKLFCILASLWCVYAASEVAAQAVLCFTGKGANVAVPLVLLFLSALSASKGTKSACAVSATLWPLCAIIFAVVLACGVGNLELRRIDLTAAPPGGRMVFVFLLPMAAFALPRSGESLIYRPIIGIVAFAVALSLMVMGTLSLPVSLTRPDAFYEFSKSLSLFSVVQRFEAIVSVGVTMSAYAMLSLLFCAIRRMGQEILPGKGNWLIAGSAAAGSAIVLFSLWLSYKILAIWSVLLWGIIALFLSICSQKKPEKSENNH